jgi:HSP20 family protein
MALIRWQPFQEMETLRRQMDQMFDEMTGLNREYQMTWKPAIELQDTDENVILRQKFLASKAKI